MSTSLDEIIKLEGLCIYGAPGCEDASDEVRAAYRQGSADAYAECAALAKNVRCEVHTDVASALRAGGYGQIMSLNSALDIINKSINLKKGG